MSGPYSHDPILNAELEAIAEDRARPPEPHPLDGKFETDAEAVSKRDPRIPLAEIAQASIAISLKRIADELCGGGPNLGLVESLYQTRNA